jgi:hypothetical protein
VHGCTNAASAGMRRNGCLRGVRGAIPVGVFSRYRMGALATLLSFRNFYEVAFFTITE